MQNTPVKRIKRLSLSDAMVESLSPRIKRLGDAVYQDVFIIDDLANFVGLMVFNRAKGKDKLSAFAQNFGKLVATIKGLSPKQQNIWLAVEDNIKSSRKIFKLFKFCPEFCKCRQIFGQTMAKTGLNKVRGFLDVIARAISCIYYIYDNVIWAASMGLLQGDKLPNHLKFLQHSVKPRDGTIITFLGGSSVLQRRKDLLSLYRLYISFLSKLTFAYKYYVQGEDISENDLSAQKWGLLGLICNFLILQQRLHGGWGGNGAAEGALGMMASFAAICEMYYNKWRRGPRPRNPCDMCSKKTRSPMSPTSCRPKNISADVK